MTANPTDFGLDYTNGIFAPGPQDRGLVTFADPTGYNLRYGRDARVYALDENGARIGSPAIDDVFELVPLVVRFPTADAATPYALRTFPLPNNSEIDFRVTYATSAPGNVFSRRWVRAVYQNLAGTITIVGSLTDEKTPIDPTGIVGLAVTTGVDSVNVTLAGKAATAMAWVATTRIVSLIRLDR